MIFFSIVNITLVHTTHARPSVYSILACKRSPCIENVTTVYSSNSLQYYVVVVVILVVIVVADRLVGLVVSMSDY